MSRRARSFALSISMAVAAAWGLTACGGGGGGPSATPQNSATSQLQPLSVSVDTTGNWLATRPVTLAPLAATDPSATIVSTSWDYGDGQKGTSASHTYSASGTYTVRVTVTDSLSRQASAQNPVVVAPMPAVPTVSLGNAGGFVTTLPTTLSPSTHAAATAPIVSTSWDYGDGQQGTTGSHTYSTPGTYTVRVTVTDSLNRQATAEGKVTVDLPAAPTVSIGAGPDSFAWQTARFSVASALGAGTTVSSESWDYGDGQGGTTSSHTYKASGNYNVSLTITDSLGRQAQATRQVVVQPCGNVGMAAAGSSTPITVCVHVQTSAGEMVFALDTVHAPVTTTNFLKYVDAGFYSGTLFHRIIKGFMAQGGGFTTGMTAKTPLYSAIGLESLNGLSNNAYTLAMARTTVINSATSQFFINFVDNAFLNYKAATSTTAVVPGYAVFGKVIYGQDIVDGLANVATTTVGVYGDVPVTDVVIQGMARIN